MASLQVDDFPETNSSVRVVRGLDSVIPAFLTRSGIAEEGANCGRLVFIDEVPAAWRVVERSLIWRQRSDAAITSQLLRWWRVELQAVADGENGAAAGMDVVLARPPGAYWFASASFKVANKKGDEARDAFLDCLYESPEEVLQQIEKLPFDFWETGKRLTAGLSIPSAPAAEVGKSYSRGQWLLGLCENIAQAVDVLSADPWIVQLQSLAQEQRLQFWPMQLELPENYRRYHPELSEEIPFLLTLALNQSLAGPEQDDLRWPGRPVAELAGEIFKDHLYRWNRRLVDGDDSLDGLRREVQRLYEADERRNGRVPGTRSENE
jgi:hypothetical protein